MNLDRLIVVGPLPPPVHGVTVSTSLVLSNRPLAQRFAIEHLDTSDHRSGGNIGRWDWTNVLGGLAALVGLCRLLPGSRGLVYLPLSQSRPGFLRDSLLISISRLAGWRIAAHLRGGELHELFARSNRWWQWWMRGTLRRLDSIAVMGDSLRPILAGLVPDERVVVVANGTPEPDIQPRVAASNHVLFLSNLRRRKGVVQSVEAALLVLEQLPGVSFTFAGTWESQELEAEARRLADRANGAIHFRQPAYGREKDELLASAAVLLFPPVEPEGHPRVVLEALAAGVPVVSTDRGAIRDTIVDGETGYLVEEPDPALLADRIFSLIEDEEKLARFRIAARNRYLERFTQERADQSLVDWLTAVSAP
jgi:glycosyltransferase involved in cell wall biosynthesis